MNLLSKSVIWAHCVRVLGENLLDENSDCSEEQLEESSCCVGIWHSFSHSRVEKQTVS